MGFAMMATAGLMVGILGIAVLRCGGSAPCCTTIGTVSKTTTNRPDCPGLIVCPITGDEVCRDRCPLGGDTEKATAARVP